MKDIDGKMIQPTNKKFHLEFCTVAHWKDGKILEERLFYDQMGMLKQKMIFGVFNPIIHQRDNNHNCRFDVRNFHTY